jgi:DNA-damage-inducible protein J
MRIIYIIYENRGVNNMAITTISINTESELRDKAQDIFLSLGLDISTAVNMFFKQTVYQEGIPFEVKLKHKERDYNPRYLLEPDTSKTPVLGRSDGLIEIPPDFDEPLEEMKEYMY